MRRINRSCLQDLRLRFLRPAFPAVVLGLVLCHWLVSSADECAGRSPHAARFQPARRGRALRRVAAVDRRRLAAVDRGTAQHAQRRGRRGRRREGREVRLSRWVGAESVVASRPWPADADRPHRRLQPARLRPGPAQRRHPENPHVRRRQELETVLRQPGKTLRRHQRGQAAGSDVSGRPTHRPLRAAAAAESAADLFPFGRSGDLWPRARCQESRAAPPCRPEQPEPMVDAQGPRRVLSDGGLHRPCPANGRRPPARRGQRRAVPVATR